MRLAFAGTPPFAARALEALSAAGHEIVLVLSQPDRPAGRGLKPMESAVARTAKALGLDVAKPASLKLPESRERISAAAPDLLIVAAYGLLLPEQVLTIPRGGCLNIHASLLPRWRGAAPVQRAILAGDAETGICIMLMEAGLDTGPVLLERRMPILERDNAATLTERLGNLGAQAIVEVVENLDRLTPHPQPKSGVTYAAKVSKSEARMDWQAPAVDLDRQVRAFNPFPGAETSLGREPLKIWESTPVAGDGRPGTVIRHEEGCPVVACGKGGLALTVIQRPGSRRMAAAEFMHARPLSVGMLLGDNDPH